MLIVLSVIFIIIFIICFINMNKKYKDCCEEVSGYDVFGGVSVFLAAIIIITTIVFGGFIATVKVTEKEVALLEEENNKINEEVKSVALQYIDKETDLYKELLDTENSQTVTLIVLTMPQLKGNTLIESYINTYTANQNEIKQKKLKIVGVDRLKFWVYFGGV